MWTPHLWIPKRELIKPKKFLPGMVGGGIFGGGGSVAFTHTDSDFDTSSGASDFTVSALSFGSAEVGDTILIGFAITSIASQSIDTFTCDGETVTVRHSHQANSILAGIATAPATGNASGNIFLDLSSGIEGWFPVGVGRLRNVSSLTPTNTDTFDLATATDMSVDVEIGGLVYAIKSHRFDGESSITWTGLTELFNIATTDTGSGAADIFGSAQTVNIGGSADTNSAAVAAAFR